MKKYYITTYRPAYPQRGVKLVATVANDFSQDCLPPTASATVVSQGRTKAEAIAFAIERLARQVANASPLKLALPGEKV
jgi:hypothetical protein